MRILSLLAALLLLSGCSETQPVRSSDDTGAINCNLDDPSGRLAEAYAAAYARCQVGDVELGPLTQQTLANFLRANFAASYEPLIASGRIRWDGPAVCAAVATLNSDTCAIDFSGLDSWDVYTGTVPLGSPCSWHEECTDDGWCAPQGGSCPGICAPRLGVGDNCNPYYDGAACPEGTTCTRTPKGSTRPKGDDCGAEPPDTCVDYAPLFASVGESCNDSTVCIRSECDGFVCQPYPTLGQPCWDFCDGGFCDPSVEECRSYLRLGEACRFRRSCADGLYCDLNAGVCNPAQANGSPCSDDFDCASGICGADRLCTSTLPVRSCGLD